MTVQILDRKGNAVRRHKVKSLKSLQGLLRDKYPEFDNMGYTMEIFY